MDDFNITVSGPDSYSRNIVLKHGEVEKVFDVTKPGTYTVSEASDSKYSPTFKIKNKQTGQFEETASFTITENNTVIVNKDGVILNNDFEILVTNKEKLATLGDYVWFDENDDGID